MKNPIGWIEIYVQDMDRAKAFYEQVFQIKLDKLEGMEIEMWTFPMQEDAYGAAGALIKIPKYPSGGNSTVVYFMCDDCEIEANRAVEAGGKIELPKKSIGEHGFMALVIDTEGNIIGLHSMQ